MDPRGWFLPGPQHTGTVHFEENVEGQSSSCVNSLCIMFICPYLGATCLVIHLTTHSCLPFCRI